jgi:hypothetical protein
VSPLLVYAVRRLAFFAVGAALLLVVVFEVLPHFGILGPSGQDLVDQAGQALDTARVYGASPEQDEYKKASELIETARRDLAGGRSQAARAEAESARLAAVAAQRAALATREADRRRAKANVDEIDAILNDLEDTYADVAPRAGKDDVPALLDVMKSARSAGAALFLANEQGRYKQVIAEVGDVRQHLREAKATLLAAPHKR